jgi:holo-[acyl-carrier protein] synthase
VAVVGIGVDAVEIARVRRALERTPSFADRVFTSTELAQSLSRGGGQRAARLAGRFAAKEAVAKALGTGVVGFGFRDVEIVNGDRGEPAVMLAAPARAVADRLGITRLHVSLSLTSTVAVATALAER